MGNFLRSHHHDLWDSYREKFNVVDPPFTKSVSSHKATVWWISGSIEYIDGLTLPVDIPQIFWLSKLGRQWPKSNSSIIWKHITHAHVGGTTKAKSIFGSRYFSLALDIPSELQQSLNHVLKFSICPTPCPPDTSDAHYTLDNCLSLSQLDRPVLYPTYMSRSGCGIRPLDPVELVVCFDLPTHMKWDLSFIVTEIVPLQLFRAVIDFVFEASVALP
jgi:hypothetical protein